MMFRYNQFVHMLATRVRVCPSILIEKFNRRAYLTFKHRLGLTLYLSIYLSIYIYIYIDIRVQLRHK